MANGVFGLRNGRSSGRVAALAGSLLLGAVAIAALLLATPASALTPPQASTGPDFGNYRFLDSTAAWGPTTTWSDYDIWPTGTNVVDAEFPTADNIAGPYPIGFAFPFYSSAPTDFYVNENGHIGFKFADLPPPATAPAPQPAEAFTPAQIPSSALPNNYIAGLFTNLAFKGCTGNIQYETVGDPGERELVVQWTDVPVYAPPTTCGPGLVTFQIRLQEISGDVLIVIKDATYTPAPGGTGLGTLVGIEEDGSNTDTITPSSDDHGVQYFFQSASVTDPVQLSNMAVRFYRDYRPVADDISVTLDEDCTTTVPATGCATAEAIDLTGADFDGVVSGFCIDEEPASGTLGGTLPPLCSTNTALDDGVAPATTFVGVTYSPDGDFCGSDEFTYRVVDDNPPVAPAAPGTPRFSLPATVTLDVTCLADTPVAVADGMIMYEDCSPLTASSCGTGALTVGSACMALPWNIRCNDYDPDDIIELPLTPHRDATRASVGTGPAAGTLKRYDGTGTSPIVDNDGSFLYRPNANYCGSDTFTYTLEDDNDPAGMTPLPAYGNLETVTITINCVNDPPAATFTKPSFAQAGDAVAFIDASVDPDGSSEIVSWAWNFNDGTTSTVRSPLHTFTSPGDYVVCLSVKDVADTVGVGCKTMSIGNAGSPPPPEQQPGAPEPGAAAGEDQVVTEGTKVVLDGKANGITATAWQWMQVAGPAVEIKNANQEDAYFTAPALPNTDPAELIFSLVVSDGTHDSPPDLISILVRRANTPPAAKAGGSIQAYEGDVVTLDGSGSTDEDGDALTFNWSPRAASYPSVLGGNAAKATFTVPAGSVDRTFVYTLEVSDGKDTNSDTVQVIVIARIYTGAGFSVETTPDGNVIVTPVIPSERFVWNFGDGSEPDATTSSGPITHTYTVAGNYTIRLTAFDEKGAVRNFEESIPVTVPTTDEPDTAVRPAPTTSQDPDAFPIWGWFAGAGFVLLVMLAILAIAVWSKK